MKGRLVRVGLVMLSGLMVAGWFGGGRKEKDSEASAPQAAAQAEPPKDEKIVYTFTDEEQLRNFATMWQQRQGIITRMAVLRAYWTEEQARLDELNSSLVSSYNLDITKRYMLDGQRRVLIELETPPITEAPVPPTLGQQLDAPGSDDTSSTPPATTTQ